MVRGNRSGAVDPRRYVPRIHAGLLANDPGGGIPVTVDGSLVFADVSGFTALSERLARSGREGAEELTNLVNAVVGRLLAVTADHDGDLLRYGGDALLLLFQDSQHERRAVAAAVAMQAAMREFRNMPSDAGRVTLRMSIGVETGRIELFLAGEDHRELLVAGRTASAVVDRQNAAGAGEVVLGERVASVIPDRCLNHGADGVIRLRLARAARLVDGTEAPRSPEKSAPTAAEAGVPPALRPHLGSVDGEHRQAAVAFVQCRGLDQLVRGQGAEAAAQALHALVTAAQRACSDQGVTFLATDVDISAAKLILVSGVPTTLGDAEDRLVAAVRAILEISLPLRVRAGVHRGRLFAVEVGDDRRRVYTVLGDTVNVAARMMAAAPDGGLLATTSALEWVRVAYHRDAVAPLSVKGKSEPIAAALVGPAEHRAPAALAPAEGPLVGREQELETLTAAVAAARAGTCAIVEIVGEPGIGKSRLLAEACAAASDLTTLVVQAREYASAAPYRAVRGAFRLALGLDEHADEAEVAEALITRAREVDAEFEPLLPLIGIPFGVHLPETELTAALGADFRREQLYSATIRFLGALLPRLGILVVEDAYWLDDGSAGLLARLARALKDRHWAILVAKRSETTALDLSDVPGVARLDLGPLPADEALELAGVAGSLSAAEAAAVVERSGGNPLFLGELATAARRGTAVDELPDTIEAVIAAHLDTLDARDRDLARVASVLGSEGPADLLIDLAGEEARFGDRTAVVLGLRRLAGVLVHDGNERFRFAHSLMREGAYAGLSFRRRRRLHARAGDLIKAHASGAEERQAAALSFHYHAARRHGDCWYWSRVAADQARHDAAPVDAAALLSRALDSAKGAGVPRPQVAAVYEQLGDVAELGGLYLTATDAYRRARRLRAGDHLAAAELLRKQGHVAEREARYAIALQLYSRGFRALEQASSPNAQARVRAELTSAYGAARLRQGRYAAAVPVLEDAARQAEAIGHQTALAHAYYLLDWARTDLGDPDPKYRDLALPIYEQLGDWESQGNVLVNLGVDAYYEGRWDDALDFYRRSREAYERVGAAVLAAAATNNIGEILSDQGHLEPARAEFRTALEVWQLSGYAIGVGLATANLGRAATRAGELDEAKRLLEAAMAELRRIGADSHVVDVVAREAERLLMVPAPDEAIAVARRARARAEQPVQRAFLDRTIGWAEAQLGDLDAATQALHESLKAAVAARAGYEEALTRQALSRLTGPDPAARTILDRLGVIWTPQLPLR